MYRRYWRYASINDLAVVVVGVTVSSLCMALFVTIEHPAFPVGFSRVVLFNDWLMMLALAGGVRLAIRVAHDPTTPSFNAVRRDGLRRVLVVGAGAAGTMVVREMRRNPQLNMEPVAFLDDDSAKLGKYVSGMRVVGDTESLPEAVSAQKIDHVVIAMPTARGNIVRAVLERCREAGVSSQTIPGVFELLGGRTSISRLRTVEISDLLRRAPVMGTAATAAVVSGKVVLITGAGGSIGFELARQVANGAPAHLVLLGHGENSLFEAEGRLRQSFPGVRVSTVIVDTRNVERLRQVFDRVRPAVVFHAAAHKHVPLMEQNPEEAVTNNVLGTRNVVREAIRAGVQRLVMISTDKAVAPTSVMGATKRLAETIVRRAARDHGRAFVVVRFGNVLGSRGSVVHTFKAQIEAGGPVTVTHPEMTRYFMTIPEAVHLVLQASGAGRGGELFVLDMGEPVKITDLARDLITLSGFDEDEVPIEFTGVRAGEKLHERLFDDDMQTRPTSHPDVMEVVGDDTCGVEDVDALVDRLEAAARDGDVAAIERLLHQAVPGFSGGHVTADR
jgi:FlaA1/EpsC-like NDP-sugar epimerase